MENPSPSPVFKANVFHGALFYGCALGLADQGKPVNKPWQLEPHANMFQMPCPSTFANARLAANTRHAKVL